MTILCAPCFPFGVLIASVEKVDGRTVFSIKWLNETKVHL